MFAARPHPPRKHPPTLPQNRLPYPAPHRQRLATVMRYEATFTPTVEDYVNAHRRRKARAAEVEQALAALGGKS